MRRKTRARVKHLMRRKTRARVRHLALRTAFALPAALLHLPPAAAASAPEVTSVVVPAAPVDISDQPIVVSSAADRAHFNPTIQRPGLGRAAVSFGCTATSK